MGVLLFTISSYTGVVAFSVPSFPQFAVYRGLKTHKVRGTSESLLHVHEAVDGLLLAAHTQNDCLSVPDLYAGGCFVVNRLHILCVCMYVYRCG